MASISASGTSFFSLKVSAWLWQRMAPTRTQKAVDRDGRRGEALAAAQDLVGLGHALPLFFGLAVAGRSLVDPGDQAAGQRHAEVRSRTSSRWCGHLAVDLEDGALGVVQQRLDGGVQRAHAAQQLAHVLRAAARGRLVGHGVTSTPPGRP
jgi:hypothetical protein